MNQDDLNKKVFEQETAEEQRSSSLFWNRLLLGLVVAGLVAIAVKGANHKDFKKLFGNDE